MPRNALLVNIDDEDVAWAIREDRWNCILVRAIQRKLPDALRVTADKEHIAFSMPDDVMPTGEVGVRYTCDTEAKVVEHVIKPFDQKQIHSLADIPEEYRTFTIIAREMKPMQRKPAGVSRTERIERRDKARKRTGSKSAAVRTYNRFLDSEADQ